MSSKPTISDWRTPYLVFANFILPIPLTLCMYLCWAERTGSNTYSLFIIVLGVLYGYLVPAFASTYFKLWRFTWRYQWKNIYVTHGFIYSSIFTLVHFVAVQNGMSWDWSNIGRVLIIDFALFGILCSHHEIVAIKQGMIVSMNSVAAKGGTPEKAVLDFAFFSFAMLGLSFGVAALYAYRIILLESVTDPLLIARTFLLCFLILLVGSSPYFIKERKQIRINRTVTGTKGS